MNRDQLIEVFKDTMETSKTIEVNSITTKHYVSEVVTPKGDVIANIKTINSDTVSSAQEYSKISKTCILNMASAKHPGGGVINGAKAQEECLFRCSNLFSSVTDTFYPINHNEGLYTTNAVFFKDKYYAKIEPFVVDVITIPAINLNKFAKYDDLDIIEDYDSIMKDKIRLMFYLAHKNECKNIILGAWGCGVFNNNPLIVANLFEEVIYKKDIKTRTSYFECFDNIVFAIINDHNSVGDNYNTFSNIF